MRISDWSSDVCSSDLRCFQATVDHGMSWARLVCLGKTGPILERADCGERIGESYGTSTFTPEQIIAKLREARSEEHTSELQSLMRISYAVFCLKKKT